MRSERLRRIAGLALGAQLVLLFAAAFWLRAFCLQSIPEHYADESFYGLQAARLARGQPFELRTSSGNLLDPFLVALQAPLHAVFRPSLTLLRAPAVASGLLAVLVVGWMGRKVLDRLTTLIAAMLLASAPVAIIFSRVGCEFSQTPLAGALAAYFALRGNGPALFLTLSASLLVHPTNIFLVPLWLPVYLVQSVGTREAGRSAMVRSVAWTLLGVAFIAGPFAALMRGNGNVSRFADAPRAPLLFLENFARFLVNDTSSTSARVFAVLGMVLLPLLGFGVPRLVRRRQWDRLTLVAGCVAGLASFDLIAGARVLVSENARYGAVFLVPVALGVACLLRALLPEPLGVNLSLGRDPRFVAISAVCWLLLVTTHANFFHYLCVGCQREWLWTFRSDDGYEQAYKAILRDARHRKIGPDCRIVTQEHFFNGLIFEYLAGRDRGVHVEALLDLRSGYAGHVHEPGVFRPQEPRVREVLESGGYVVAAKGPDAWGGDWLSPMIQASYPPGRLRCWSVPTVAGPWVHAYRLEPAPQPVAARPSNEAERR